MIKFDTDDLKNKIKRMIECFSFVDGDVEDIPFEKIFHESDKYDMMINEDSKVCLHMGEDDYPITTLKNLLSICDEWNKTKINEDQNYAQSLNEVDFLLQVDDYDTIVLLDGLERSDNPVVYKDECGISIWKSDIKTGKGIYHICLFKGLCLYHLKVEESGNFDEYLPSYSRCDYFVKITSDSVIDISIADSLAISFVFELQSTHNLVLNFSNGRPNPDDIYYDDNELTSKSFEIFPLVYGRGIKTLLELYNSAKSTYNIDYKILSFTKVIEYVAPTIAKSDINERVMLKLKSRDVLCPTSTFVDELGELYKKYQNDITKDSELIKLSVEKTISFYDVWKALPLYLRSTKYKSIESIDEIDDTGRLAVVERICEAIYDTRNEIAHAKANYVKKGNECPQNQKAEFVNLLDIIAIGCIRWFSLQPEDKRVI